MVVCFAAWTIIVFAAFPVASSFRSETTAPMYPVFPETWFNFWLAFGLTSALTAPQSNARFLTSDVQITSPLSGISVFTLINHKFQAKLYLSNTEALDVWNSTLKQWCLALGYVQNMKQLKHLPLWDTGVVFRIVSLQKLSKTAFNTYIADAIAKGDLGCCLLGRAQFNRLLMIVIIDFKDLQNHPFEETTHYINLRKLMQVQQGQNVSNDRLTENTNMMANVRSERKVMKLMVDLFVGGSMLLFFVVLVVAMFILYKRKKRQQTTFQKKESLELPIYIAKSVLEPHIVELKSMKAQQFSLRELSEATNTFNKRIGEGGFGAVYHGMLPDGQAIAVKVRSANSIQGQQEFNTELRLLSELQHDNLVPLIGFCPEQQILVYPFMSNGSLQDRLYAHRKPVDWITRLNIALGAAKGLHYLYSSAGVRCIIHRDVKSSNILLDDSMVAKVADFGFSKYAPEEGDSMVSLEVRVTAGYLDPEYYSTQQLTVKSDVFSFGVVLLEIICGREPLNTQRPRAEWSLVEWAKYYFQESNIQAIVDPAISSSYTPEAMWRVMEIAMLSVEPRGLHRPTMEDIVRELEDALIIENSASQYMASMSIESLASGGPLSISDGSKAPPPMPFFYQFDPSPVFSEATTAGSPDPS